MPKSERIHNMNEPIHTNERGASQSVMTHAPHLVPGEALVALIDIFSNIDKDIAEKFREGDISIHVNDAVVSICKFLNTAEKIHLDLAFAKTAIAVAVDENLQNVSHSTVPPEAILRIAETVALGEAKYGTNNWRLLDGVDNISHGFQHLLLWQTGDRNDDHLGHALTRLSFAIATAPKDGWDFKKITIPKRK